MILSHLSCLENHFSINEYFIKDVVDISESAVVSGTNSQGLDLGEISIPEEPGGLSQKTEMGKSSSSIEEVVIVSDHAIKSIVFSFSKLGIEH